MAVAMHFAKKLFIICGNVLTEQQRQRKQSEQCDCMYVFVFICKFVFGVLNAAITSSEFNAYATTINSREII